MAEVKFQRVADFGKKPTFPVFREMEQVAERVHAKAFDLFSRRGFESGHALDDWLAAEREICWPAGELIEEERAFTLNVALPGFEAADIAVTDTPGDLIVHAKSKTESKKTADARKGQKVCWSEFRSNDVHRQVGLPSAIDAQSVSATLQNGMLKITAGKAMQALRAPPIASAAA
jgi:HSP20 family protein